MLLHLFYAPPHYLNVSIIKSFLHMKSFKSLPQIFVLYGSLDNKLKSIYEELSLYEHINIVYLNDFISLLKFSRKYKKETFLLHGNLPYKVMTYLSLYSKRTDWICWGGKSKINYNNIKSIILTPLKTIVYKRFYKIITLMDPDTDSLMRDFYVNNIEQISYFNPAYKIDYDYFLQFVNVNKNQNQITQNQKKKILLGNSAHNLPFYLDTLSYLSNYRETIDVHCMMQYPKLGEREYVEFTNQAHLIFKDSITMDRVMFERYQYFKYLSDYDVYICSNLNQSGLGAATICLRLGLKVFLAGKNYEWLSSLGYKVFNVEDIKKSDSVDVFKNMSKAEKDYNLNLSFTIVRDEENKWTNYRNTLA